MAGMLTVNGLEIPPQIVDLATFREWAETLGESAARIHFSHGNVWIDMSPQRYGSHLSVVEAIGTSLGSLARQISLGRYWPDGGWVTNEAADLSTEPDGFLVLWETFRSGAARLVPRAGKPDAIELVGRGDMVLEVVSDRSEKKDTIGLVRDYATAGFSEYWIVDARTEPLSFRILTLTAGQYSEVPADPAGWVASPVWGREFRLVRGVDPAGLAIYDLLHRP